jgi:hypothetical protein
MKSVINEKVYTAKVCVYCKKNDLFYQSICYPLRVLKNSSGHHVRWLECLKGPCFFWIPVQLRCPPNCMPNPSRKPFSQSGTTVNLWPGQIPGEEQVRLSHGYKEEPPSAILCLYVCSAGVSTCLHPLDQEKIALSRFSLSLVCLNSNNLGTPLRFYIPFRKGVPALPWGDASCCLTEVVPRLGQGNNFLDLQMNSDSRISWQHR